MPEHYPAGKPFKAYTVHRDTDILVIQYNIFGGFSSMCNLYKSFVIFYSQLLTVCNRLNSALNKPYCNAVLPQLSKLPNHGSLLYFFDRFVMYYSPLNA